MQKIPSKLKKLIESFQRFPGVGYKSAERMSFNLLDMDKKYVEDFSLAIKESLSIKRCEKCNNISEDNLCFVCLDESRKKDVVCVVADVKSLIAIENSSSYDGQYFVLNKLISPSKGFLPVDINVDLLIQKIENFSEVILALNSSIEGETTKLFLSDLLKSHNLKISTLGYGLPVGSNIEYSDEITIARSFENRKEIKK